MKQYFDTRKEAVQAAKELKGQGARVSAPFSAGCGVYMLIVTWN